MCATGRSPQMATNLQQTSSSLNMSVHGDSSLQQTFSSLPMSVHGPTRDTANGSSLTRDLNSNSTMRLPDSGNDDFIFSFDNPLNLVSADTRQTMMKLLDYVFILFVIVGVPGNVINCLVFYRQVSTVSIHCEQ